MEGWKDGCCALSIEKNYLLEKDGGWNWSSEGENICPTEVLFTKAGEYE